MRQIASIHIGQAGIRIGSAYWQLICREHGISSDGILSEPIDDTLATFFSEAPNGRYVPRSLFVDTESNICDEVRSGSHSHLYNSDLFVTGKEDASCIYGRGHYTIGKEIIDATLDRIRKLAEACSDLEGFIFTHSIGGGTGSGFGTLLLERLSLDFAKKSKMSFCLLPSNQTVSSTVEPYNAVLSLHIQREHANAIFLLDNQPIYEICQRSLSIPQPDFGDANRLIAEVISTATASYRFKDCMPLDLGDIRPGPGFPSSKLNFYLLSYSHGRHPIPNDVDHSLDDLTSSLFQKENLLAPCDLESGMYASIAIMYRGDMNPKEVKDSVHMAKTLVKTQFVDWVPTSIKCGLVQQPPISFAQPSIAIQRSALMFCNSSAVQDVFFRIGQKFDAMYARRAFVFWSCGEGMSEGEFPEAREDIESLLQDYQSLSHDQVTDSEADM